MALFEKERLPKQQKQEETVKKPTIMIVDDEEKVLESMYSLLSEDYHIIKAGDGAEALALIQGMEQPQNIGLIISDKRMPQLNGIQLFEKLKEIVPNTFRIILTAFDDKKDIIEAINKAKIHEYITKPFEPEDLKIRVKHAVENFELKRELEEYRRQLELTVEKRTEELKNTQAYLRQTEKVAERLKESLLAEGPKHPEYFKDIITQSKKMVDIFKCVEAIAIADEPILITGETGTGKELIAQAIHKASARKGKFVTANIAGFDDQLFSDTLFGHEKNSFTDAKTKRMGLVENACDGTFFLDEIGDLKLQSQVKLLRLIEKQEYYRIGSDENIQSNTRFVLATNKNLNEMIETGEFREDLYFRLSTNHIQIPPLRERKEDMRPLFQHFIEEASSKYGKEMNPVPEKLIFQLSKYFFPGNVRELRGLIYGVVGVSQTKNLTLDVFIDEIKKLGREKYLPEEFKNVNHQCEEKNEIIFGDFFPTFEELKKIYAIEALKRSGNNQSKAAEMAAIDRATLKKWLE